MSYRNFHFHWLCLVMALSLSAQAQYTKTTFAGGAAFAWNRNVVLTKPNGGYLEWLSNGSWVSVNFASWYVNGMTPTAIPGSGPVNFGETTKTFTYRWAGTVQEYSFIVPIAPYTVTATLSSYQDTSTIQLPPFEISLFNGTGDKTVTSTQTGDQGPPPPPPHDELTLMLNNDTGVPKNIMWGDKMITLQPGINAIRYDGPIDSVTGFPTVGPSDLAGRLVTGPDGRAFFAATLSPSGLDSGEVRWSSPPPEPYSLPPAQQNPQAPRVEIIATGNATQGNTVIIHNPDGTRTITTLPVLQPPFPPQTSGGSVATLTNPTLPPVPPNSTNTVNNSTSNTTNNSVTNITNVYGEDPSDDASVAAMNSGVAAAEDNTVDGVPTFDGELASGLDSSRAGIADKIRSFQVLQSGSLPKATAYSITFNCGRFGSVPVNVDFTSLPIQLFRALLLVAFAWVLASTLLNRIQI